MKKIPYWHQTSEASCGPCCLLMIFNYYNPKYRLSREKEWELWRENSLLSWRGTHPYGLAVAALKRGFKVTLFREKKTFWKDKIFPKNNEPLRYEIKNQEKNAKRLGLIEKIKKDMSVDFLKQIIEKNVFPIVLMRFIRKNYTLSPTLGHWVVLLDIKKDYVIIHDPYAFGNRKIPIKIFIKAWNKIRIPSYQMVKEVLVIKK